MLDSSWSAGPLGLAKESIHRNFPPQFVFRKQLELQKL